MSKRFLPMALAAIVAVLASGCQNDTPEKQETKGQRELTFSVMNYVQTSLDDVTRADEATTLNYLDMVIYKAGSTTPVEKKQTEKGSEGYGSFSATLEYGEYTVVFLGYDGTRVANIASPTDVSFANDYANNFFYKTLNLTVSATSEATQNVVLKRAVAAFQLKNAGSIPTTLATLTVVAKGGGAHFNPQTGYAPATADRELTYNVASLAGGTSFTLNYYTFLTMEEATMDFTVTAKAANGDVLQEREFSGVPMKINQRSTYTGAFFGASSHTQGFSLKLESAEWDETEHSY